MSPAISKINFSKQIKSCEPKIVLTLNKFKKNEDVGKSCNIVDVYEFKKQNIIIKMMDILLKMK